MKENMNIDQIPNGSYPAIVGGYVTEIRFGGQTTQFKSLSNGVRGIGISDNVTISGEGDQRRIFSNVLGVVYPNDETPISEPPISIAEGTYNAHACSAYTTMSIRGRPYKFQSTGIAVKGFVEDTITVIHDGGRLKAISAVLGKVSLV